MKNAMKKLMSLVLVAMILVSAVPFAASADGFAALVIHVDGAALPALDATPNSTVTIADCLSVAGVSAADVASVDPAADFVVGEAGSVANVYITLKAEEPAPQPEEEPAPQPEEETITETEEEPAPAPQPEEEPAPQPAPEADDNSGVAYLAILVNGVKKYDTAGTPNSKQAVSECLSVVGVDADDVTALLVDCKGETQNTSVNGVFKLGKAGTTTNLRLTVEKKSSSSNSGSKDNTVNVNNGQTSTQATTYTKFSYPVYLNIYTDTTVGTVKKTINITNGIAADGRVTLNEVKKLVFEYYTSKSAAGITFDGLYPAQGNWVMDYVADEKYTAIEGLFDAAADNYVYINVMLTNAKAISSSSSSNADSSNPKTGDEIYVAVTVMALSASALALGFYFNKKRAY